MASLNMVQIIGNMTADPELRKTTSGQNVVTVGVATNRKWTNKTTGEVQEDVEFHNVVCWGKLAEIVNQYLKKGSQVYFQGRLQTRSWEKENVKHYKTEMIAEQMVMLGSRPANAAPAASAASAENQDEDAIKVDDLPF